MKKCPKCKVHTQHEDDTECWSCGVQFADLKLEKRARQQPDKRCAFNDHGYQCTHTGIFSDSVVGGGPWYCREHDAVLRGVAPAGKGNEDTRNWREVVGHNPATQGPAFVRNWHKQMRAFLGRGDLPIGREPGCYDE